MDELELLIEQGGYDFTAEDMMQSINESTAGACTHSR
jgi:hypothetical protein